MTKHVPPAHLALLLILIVVLLSSCATDKMLLRKQKVKSAPLVAKIYNGENRACPSVLIELTNSKNKKQQIMTDITGKAIIPDLRFDDYQVILSKEGYESITFPFSYNTEGQSLYGRLFSTDQLMRLSQKSIDKEEWKKALSYLDRANTINTESLDRIFLRSIIYWKQGHLDKAEELLSLQDRNKMPVDMLLFYADVLQYDQKRLSEAENCLNLIQQIKPSNELKQRIQSIRNQIEREENNQ